ncbi:uncharacterized protein DC041_0012803 [Schistosoma bovis]|uniref:Fucosyltransferase n=1 Tax=Schistosoma bovis TaxID=6184 RepID=A0A430QI85_SCHBO|nr:uncharacterized protein DC041_0012803 [Schistosoma bovis]
MDQFENSRKVSKCLMYLDNNNTAYNQYFSWHDTGDVKMWSANPESELSIFANALYYLKPVMYKNFIFW